MIICAYSFLGEKNFKVSLKFLKKQDPLNFSEKILDVNRCISKCILWSKSLRNIIFKNFTLL